MRRCPFCKCKIKFERYFCDYIMLEEYGECTNCKKYYYEFIHGNERYCFENKEICFYWSESYTKLSKKYFILGKMVRKARKKYLKSNKVKK